MILNNYNLQWQINLYVQTKTQIKQIREYSKINESPHKAYAEYYNDECRKLVIKKDRYIFKKFNYETSLNKTN